MSSNRNSVSPYWKASIKDVQDSLGITQFSGERSWYHTIGGLLIQGGYVEAVTHPGPVTIPFIVGFPLQVLGVFPQEIGTNAHSFSVDNITLESYDLYLSSGPSKDFYWFAIGV